MQLIYADFCNRKYFKSGANTDEIQCVPYTYAVWSFWYIGENEFNDLLMITWLAFKFNSTFKISSDHFHWFGSTILFGSGVCL